MTPLAAASAAPEATRWEAWRRELRETGELGKQEWERIFARWGAQWRSFRSEPLARRAEEARDVVAERLQHTLHEAQRTLHTTWSDVQARGAQLWGAGESSAPAK